MNFTREQEITVENFNYSNLKKWIKCFSHKDKVEIAVYSAELVIDLYNGTSDGPKLAIQAAKDWLLNPTKENKDKCLHAAASAAAAAYAAADADADAAAAAAAAADAAASAAAADAAADADAAAAADAARAFRNSSEIKGKIVCFILSFIDKEKKEAAQESKKAEIDNTQQQVESLSKESEYDKGMRECVKNIARIVGLNFPVNVGYGNLADEVKESIDLMDHKLERAIKSLEQSGFVDNGGEYWKPPVHPAYEKLIKALGYIDHHLSIDGLIERVAEMKEELDKALLTIGERDIEDLPEWKSGDECEFEYPDGVWNLGYFHGKTKSLNINILEYKNGGIELLGSLTNIRKPLTPEQKQQKIDEQNGELFFCLWSKVDGNDDCCRWKQLKFQHKKLWVSFAKKVSFEGKLESI